MKLTFLYLPKAGIAPGWSITCDHNPGKYRRIIVRLGWRTLSFSLWNRAFHDALMRGK